MCLNLILFDISADPSVVNRRVGCMFSHFPSFYPPRGVSKTSFRTSPPLSNLFTPCPLEKHWFSIRLLFDKNTHQALKKCTHRTTWLKNGPKLKGESSFFHLFLFDAIVNPSRAVSVFLCFTEWELWGECGQEQLPSKNRRNPVFFCITSHSRHILITFWPHLADTPHSKLPLFIFCADVRSISLTLHTLGEHMPEKVPETNTNLIKCVKMFKKPHTCRPATLNSSVFCCRMRRGVKSSLPSCHARKISNNIFKRSIRVYTNVYQFMQYISNCIQTDIPNISKFPGS